MLKRLLSACVPAVLLSVSAGAQAGDTATVRKKLERAYAENSAAYTRGDLLGVMALRDSAFHSVSADGRVQDRAALEHYVQGIMNGVRKWNSMTVTIDSLRVVGDTAFAITDQHLDRMALRADNQVHHVETWVTQREVWIRRGGRWLMWRVDQLRNQRRLVDGRPG